MLRFFFKKTRLCEFSKVFTFFSLMKRIKNHCLSKILLEDFSKFLKNKNLLVPRSNSYFSNRNFSTLHFQQILEGHKSCFLPCLTLVIHRFFDLIHHTGFTTKVILFRSVISTRDPSVISTSASASQCVPRNSTFPGSLGFMVFVTSAFCPTNSDFSSVWF